MKTTRTPDMTRAVLACLLVLAGTLVQAAEVLPSWHDGKARQAIVAFVEKVTRPDSPDFVPPAGRIAVFDNDGCLWAEQPMYFQAIFIFDRIRQLAPQHPEWKNRQPFAAVLNGDVKAALAGGEKALLEMAMALNFIDDKAGKPVGIQQHIGRRPIMAFGNSDGDFEMLEWTTSGPGARFGLIVHHTDAEREWAYDRESHIGRLARGLDEAPKRGWAVVSMKKDWKVVFPR